MLHGALPCRSHLIQTRLAIFLLALLSLLAAGTEAMAAQPPGLDGFRNATASFSFLLVEANAQGAMPRMSDPRAASAIRGMTDTNAVLGHQRFDESDLPVLLDVCDRVAALVMDYSVFGAHDLVPANLDLPARQKLLNRLMLDNARAYQDEMAPLIAFTIACSARELPPLAAHAARLTPAQRADFQKAYLVKVRSNLMSIVDNSARMLGDDRIREGNRSRVANALLANIDGYASALGLRDRQQLLGAVQAVQPHASGAGQAALSKIAAALQRQDCSGLCPYMSP